MPTEYNKKPKTYLRDKRSPTAVSEQVSYTMSRIRAKNTKPELWLRKALWSAGVRGYRLHWKKAPGKPDIAWPGRRRAIFVNGCFWHRCPLCNLILPKSNARFWKEKFSKNIARDKRKTTELELAGWTVMTIWECQLKKELDSCVGRVVLWLAT